MTHALVGYGLYKCRLARRKGRFSHLNESGGGIARGFLLYVTESAIFCSSPYN